MALLNPTPGFNFHVFLFDVKESLLPKSLGEAAMSLGSLAIGVGKGVLFGSFSEVSGLNAEIEIEEYREGGSNAGPLRFAKWGRYPNLSFKRGVTFNTDLWDWSYQVLHGSKAPIRKNGLVLLNGHSLGLTNTSFNLPGLDTIPVALWFFRSGLPEKLIGPTLNAKTNEIAVESLEIAHQGLIRIGPGLIPGIGETVTQLGL